MIPLYNPTEFDSAKSRDKLPLKCYKCGNTFYVEKNNIKKTIFRIKTKSKIYATPYKYCSRTCEYIFRTTKKPFNCYACNNVVYKTPSELNKSSRVFCNHSCAATYNNTHKTTGNRRSKLEIWLEQELPKLYPKLEIHFNRKDAINSELDIYIPSLKLAFELNGIFHYEPIYGKDKLNEIKNNDERKFQACLEKGIEFCIVDTSKQERFTKSSSTKYLEIITSVINKVVKVQARTESVASTEQSATNYTTRPI